MKKVSLIALAILGMFALSSCELLVSGIDWTYTFNDDYLTSTEMENAEEFPQTGTRTQSLTTGRTVYIWEIRITVSEAVRIFTAPVSGAPTVDTKLHLYSASGTHIETDDDDGEGLYSNIERVLSTGTYYIAVTPYSSSDTGDFTIDVDGGGYARPVETEE